MAINDSLTQQPGKSIPPHKNPHAGTSVHSPTTTISKETRRNNGRAWVSDDTFIFEGKKYRLNPDFTISEVNDDNDQE